MTKQKFKYYHGTSTIFLDSIKKHGLGKINPNFDFKNLDVLKFLYEKAEQYLLGDSTYIIWRQSINAMVNQTDLEIHNQDGTIQKFNYKHDGMYISLSRERAAIYACLNKFGSEILESCVKMIELLRVYNIEINIPEEINLFGVEKYLNIEPKPIIVEIIDVEDEELEKEDGKTAPEALDFLRNIIPTLNEKERFEFLQYCNFKTLNAIASDKLRFYEVEFEGHPRDHDFFYTLSRI